MDLAATLAEISILSVEDRIRLVQAIWDSIDAQSEQFELTEAQKQELSRRLEDCKAYTNTVISWEEAKAQALARARVSTSAIVTLREITKENLDSILNLKVALTQENFVASNAVSIAQAHFYPEVAWFRAIYADETPVGFVMLEDDPANSSYFLWRFMIDARFQKCGFGRRALELAIEHVKTRPGAKA
jgi:diamine N-acetyltransferase